MGIKTKIISLIGKKNAAFIKGILTKIKRIIGNTDDYINRNLVDEYCFISQKNKNCFMGYYDIEPLSSDKRKILVQTVPLNANPKNKKTELGYYDLINKNFTILTTSSAWSWQQGSRLRWSNKDKDCIYYNDIIDGKSCTKKMNIKTKKIVNKYPIACYDISPDESYGLTLDFARLQRLRPGYGYENLDEKDNSKASENNGIYKVNFSNSTVTQLVSLKELSEITDPNLECEHYLNHISISPDSSKFIFFHIRNVMNDPIGRRVDLCVMSADGGDLRSFGEEYLYSHYTWISDDELLITGIEQDMSQTYRVFNVNTMESYILNKDMLNKDGHPTFITEDCFITDTYPDNKNSNQKLYVHNISKNQNYLIAELFANPLLFDDKRCDLHPKLSKIDKKSVFIDTTSISGKRSVLYLHLAGKNSYK